MNKARLISLTTSLCLTVFWLQGCLRPLGHGLDLLGLGSPGSWFDGHGG
jgi:hypothetical protein